jgi:hypothetical protein
LVRVEDLLDLLRDLLSKPGLARLGLLLGRAVLVVLMV